MNACSWVAQCNFSLVNYSDQSLTVQWSMVEEVNNRWRLIATRVAKYLQLRLVLRKSMSITSQVYALSALDVYHQH